MAPFPLPQLVIIVLGPSMKSPKVLGDSHNGLYVLQAYPPVVSKSVKSCTAYLNSALQSKGNFPCSLSSVSFSDVNSRLWHIRLGHMPLSNMKNINEIPTLLCSKFNVPCEICPLAKQAKLPFPN
ncbi:hypothetical protein AABB24_007647, partial [Solanum stoloniferum]